ncbi:MAG: hypothetical protein QOJ51_4258 [Acidobacteriaceae bacterium]|nr:hypothetical protein [Acidobacteriaceae bacterium]
MKPFWMRFIAWTAVREIKKQDGSWRPETFALVNTPPVIGFGDGVDEGESVRRAEAGGVVPSFFDGEEAVDAEAEIDVISTTQIPHGAGETSVAVECAVEESGRRIVRGTVLVDYRVPKNVGWAGERQNILYTAGLQSGDGGSGLSERMSCLLIAITQIAVKMGLAKLVPPTPTSTTCLPFEVITRERRCKDQPAQRCPVFGVRCPAA